MASAAAAACLMLALLVASHSEAFVTQQSGEFFASCNIL
jgi:hypothetical protein